MEPEQVLIPLVRSIASRPTLCRVLFGWDRWGSPLLPATVADPCSTIDQAIGDGPIAYRRLYQQWFVLGYDEAKQMLSHHDVVAGGQIETILNVRPYTKLSERSRSFFKTLLPVLDPPAHDRIRSLVGRTFTPKRISALESNVQKIVDDLLDALPQSGPIDIRNGFAVPLPINVVADMLGIPEEKWEWVRSRTSEVVQLLDPFIKFDPDTMNQAIDDMFEVYGTSLQTSDERTRPMTSSRHSSKRRKTETGCRATNW